jgi:hypothetical protein
MTKPYFSSRCIQSRHKRCKNEHNVCKCNCHVIDYTNAVAELSIHDRKILLNHYQTKYDILSGNPHRKGVPTMKPNKVKKDKNFIQENKTIFTSLEENNQV